MANTPSSITQISETIARQSVLSYLLRRDDEHEDHILVSKLFPVEYKMKSGIHGLVTSLGTSLWESLAKKIASNNGFQEIVDANLEEVDLDNSLNFPQEIHQLVGSWTATRPVDSQTGEVKPLTDFTNELAQVLSNVTTQPSLVFRKLSHGQGLDVFLEKNGVEYAYDIKTVQPTSSSGNDYYRRLINWYEFRFLQKKYQRTMSRQQHKDFRGHIVIPYDTTQRGWWIENGASASPLTSSELLVGNDFWDFMSGISNTIEAIEQGFMNVSNDEALVNIYRECIADGSDAPRLKLLRYERSVEPQEQIKISSKAAKSLKCIKCDTLISVKLDHLLSPNYSCPEH